jgi:hypothetical protein
MDEIQERQRLEQVRLEKLRLDEEVEFYEDKLAGEQKGAKGVSNRRQVQFSGEVPEPGAPFSEQAEVYANDTESTVQNKKKRLTGLWVLLALVLAAMGYSGYNMLRSTGELPQLPAYAASNGEPSLTLPATNVQALDEALKGPVVAIETPAQEPTDVVVPAAPSAPIASSADVELNAKLDRLETRLSEIIEGLRASGYITTSDGVGGQSLSAASFAPYRAAPAPIAAAPVRRASVRQVVQRASRPAVPIAQRTQTSTGQQLLSVDLWNGRPSVVVSNGDRSAPQVKVMQLGDTYNGITLTSADVASQRATFSDGARSLSLDAAK